MKARVIVTGGTGTLGRAVCRALAARGAKVGFTFHREEALARALAEELPDAATERLDLTDADAIEPALSSLAGRLGGVDAFVHCAGLASIAEPARADALEELESAGWDRLMAVNVKAPAFACRALAEALAEGGGNVVLLGSINGVKPVPAPVPYAASKAALIGLAEALSKELGPRGVKVNVVAPGLVDEGASLTLPDALREDYVAHTALKRFATKEEIAKAVAYFALDNTYVNGRTVVFDGGL